MPQVSVLMPVHNGERYLRQAVESVLGQSFSDFELIALDDGSTDGTWAILESYDDPRVRLVRSRDNVGLPRSLNRGLALARGRYVARMDADDVALPHRLERQVAFMRAHPEVGLLGSVCHMVDPQGRRQGLYLVPGSDLEIRWAALLRNPFAHPSVMICRDLLVRHGLAYDATFRAAEDYDLWTRLLPHTRAANLDEPLLLYRVSDPLRMSARRRREQLQEHDAIALRAVRQGLPGLAIDLRQVGQLRALVTGTRAETPVPDGEIVALVHLYLDMLQAFTARHRGAPGLGALQRGETWRAAHLALSLRRYAGWMGLLARLTALNPRLLRLWAGNLGRAFLARFHLAPRPPYG